MQLQRDSAALQQLLATGTMSDRPVLRLPGGINGPLDVHDITDPLTGQAERAVMKPVAQGGAHEVFGYEVGAALGMEDLLAATGRRVDGAAAIEFVPNAVEFGDFGIRDAADMERALAKGYAKRAGLPIDAARGAAEVDRQAMLLFDVAIGNRDRNLRNGLYDAATGRAVLLDVGKLGSYKGGYPLNNSPLAIPRDATVVRHMPDGRSLIEAPLRDEVVDLARAADRDRIGAAFSTFADDVRGLQLIGHNGNQPTGAWLDALHSTLDDAVRHGTVRFVTRLR